MRQLSKEFLQAVSILHLRQRPIDSREARLLAKDRQRVEHTEPDRRARRGDADRVDDLPHLDPLGLDELVQQPIQTFRIECFSSRQRFAKLLQQIRHFLRLLQAFFKGLLVKGQIGIRREEVAKVNDVAGHLDPVPAAAATICRALALAVSSPADTIPAFSR